jgi:hypothetical protein
MDEATNFTGNNMPSNAKYKVVDATATTPKTLQIRTNVEVFMFNTDCSMMFAWAGNKLFNITSIKFNDCVNTENVTDMSSMFLSLQNLEELDLRCFVTSNVTTCPCKSQWNSYGVEC